MHGIDLDQEQKHTPLSCKTLAALCGAAVCDGRDRKIVFGSQSPGFHTHKQREEPGFLLEAKTSRSLQFLICHAETITTSPIRL